MNFLYFPKNKNNCYIKFSLLIEMIEIFLIYLLNILKKYQSKILSKLNKIGMNFTINLF